MDHPVEERPGRQNDRFSPENGSVDRPNPPGRPSGDDHLGDDALEKSQIRHNLEPSLHGQPVDSFVALGPGRLDRSAPAAVEEPELDARLIGEKAHQASESIYLPDEMALGQAADGRIAGHLGDGLEVDGHERGPEAHGARCRGRFAAGMPGSDHDDVEIRSPGHRFPLFPDTEAAEDVVEDLLDAHFTGHLAD